MFDAAVSYVESVIDFFWPIKSAPNDLVSPVKREIRKKSEKTKDVDSFVEGNYKTISNLLNALDDLYALMKKLKPRGNEAVKAMKNIGIYSHGKLDIGIMPKLCVDAVFPAVFAVHYYLGDHGDDYLPSIYWANKIKWNRGMGVQKPKLGWLYEFGCTALVDGKTWEMFTWIDVSSGQPEILKRRTPRYVKSGNVSYMHNPWEKVTMSSHSQEVDDETYTKELFCIALNLYLARARGTEVHVLKKGQRMVFTVPEHRWKSFFSDRVIAKASDGRRKRIFHHVAAHRRFNGTYVPMHTRGQTKFLWNGYDVRIVEQKKGRLSIVEFDHASIVPDDMDDVSEYMMQGAASKRLIAASTRDLHVPSDR